MKNGLQSIFESGRAPGMNLKTPDPTCADVAAPRGLKQMEEQMGTARLERELGMKASKLKKIWNINLWLVLASLAMATTHAGELTRGTTLSDGSTLYASDLHNLVDTATISATFYTDQQQVYTLSSGYTFLIYDSGSGAFRRISAQAVLYGNTNYFTGQSYISSVPPWNRVILYNPTNNALYSASVDNIVASNSTNVSTAGLRFMTNQVSTLPTWGYGFSVFQTNNAPLLAVLGTNADTLQTITLSNAARYLAADLGTNLSLPYTYAQVFRPVITNTPTSAWSANTNFAITNLSMFGVTNATTLTNADTVPLHSTMQGTNTTMNLDALYQYLQGRMILSYVGSNSVPAVAKTNIYPHNFGTVPNSVRVSLVCTNADSAVAYAAGDEVDVSSVQTTSQWNAFDVWADRTNVYVMRSDVAAIYVMKRGTGTRTAITAASQYNIKVIAHP